MKKLSLISALLLLAACMLLLAACSGSQPAATASTRLASPNLFIDDAGLVTWQPVEGADHYECYLNRGLSENGEQSTDERFEKQEETSFLLSPGDTLEVYACGGDKKSDPASVVYATLAGADEVDRAHANLRAAWDDIGTMTEKIKAYDEALTAIKANYERDYAAAATKEERDAVYSTYTQQVYRYRSPLLDTERYAEIFLAAPALEQLMETDAIYSIFSKLALRDLRAEVAAFREDAEALRVSYETRMSVSYISFISRKRNGERRNEGDLLLFSRLSERVSLTTLAPPVLGYQPSVYELDDGSVSSEHEISHGYLPKESFLSLDLIYEPIPYTLTFDLGEFRGIALGPQPIEIYADETVALPPPFCNELFFDAWVDEDGNKLTKRELSFDGGRDITLTATWKRDPTNRADDWQFENANTYEAPNGDTVVTVFGLVETAFGEDGRLLVYVRPTHEENGYLVRNPMIREYGAEEWLEGLSGAELMRLVSHAEQPDGKPYSGEGDDCCFHAYLVCVQGILINNEGRRELQGAKLIKLIANSWQGGLSMDYAANKTEEFTAATDYATLKAFENSIVTLRDCTVLRDTVDGMHIVTLPNASLSFKLSFETRTEAGDTSVLPEDLIFDEAVTLRVIVRYREDKGGNSEIWLEPANAELFIESEG